MAAYGQKSRTVFVELDRAVLHRAIVDPRRVLDPVLKRAFTEAMLRPSSPMTNRGLSRYEREVLKSAQGNHIWINGFSAVSPSNAFAAEVGHQVLRMLKNSENTILCDYDGTSFEELEQRELIVRINQS